MAGQVVIPSCIKLYVPGREKRQSGKLSHWTIVHTCRPTAAPLHTSGDGAEELQSGGREAHMFIMHLFQEDFSASKHLGASDKDEVEVDREGTGQPVP